MASFLAAGVRTPRLKRHGMPPELTPSVLALSLALAGTCCWRAAGAAPPGRRDGRAIDLALRWRRAGVPAAWATGAAIALVLGPP
jgi:hypothetical protein